MENIHQSSSQIQTLEKEMIKEIIDGYFKCKSFFSNNQDNHNSDQIIAKKEFLASISKNFFDKFTEHPYMVRDAYGQEVLEKFNRVLLKFRDGGFFYPFSFSRYMDRLQDINIIPIREIDFSPLDTFMTRFSIVEKLDDFLQGFFQVMKTLSIPMRERDVELLKILTNPYFLHLDSEGKARIREPEYEEILKVLNYSKKQWHRVKRSFKFLYRFRICYINMFIMNAAKFGFFYAMIEYQENNPDIELIKNYIHLDLSFKNHRVAIVCVPHGNVSELLKNFDFIPLTEWKWNFNFHEFSHDKNDTFDGWGSYSGPDLLSKSTRIDDYVHWDLETSYKDEFSSNEVEIIKNMSRSNALSLRSLDLLSEKQSSGGIRHHLANFAQNGVFQLYPHTTHLGLKDIIFVKINCEDKEFFKSLQHNFLSFPEAHIFTNEKENLLVGYIHLPSKLTNKVTDQLNLLNLLLGEKINLEFEILPKDKMLRKFIEFSKFNFAIRHGSAFLVE